MDVARDAGEAGVDDAADAGDGDGGLGDIRRENDAPARGGAESPLLLRGGERGEEGNDVVVAAEAREGVGRFADVAFSGKEDEDVVRGGERGDGGGDISREVEFVVLAGRTVDELDGEEASGHRNDGGVVEELREALHVERRGGDDHLEITAAHEDPLEDAEQEVDVEGALVGLVDDDDVVGPQKGVGPGFGEQDAVGHELDAGLAGDLASEAVLIADESANLALQFMGDAFGHRDGGEAAGLGAGDSKLFDCGIAGLCDCGIVELMERRAEFEGHLGKLGRLAGTGVAADDDDGMGAQRGEDFVTVRADGKFGGIVVVQRLDVGFIDRSVGSVVHGVKW